MASTNRSSVTRLQRELDGLTSSPSVGGLIRVPQHMRSLDEEGYTPRLVSIGPFHHGQPGLTDFEAEKLICLQAFLSWSDLSLESLFDRVIAGKEDRINSFYAPGTYDEDLVGVGDAFHKIILADATFIVAAMLGGLYEYEAFRPVIECLYRRSYTLSHIIRDLALLENQVPLFILTELHGIIKERYSRIHWSFCKLATWFFRNVTISHTKMPNNYCPADEGEVRHLVDLLTRFHRPSNKRTKPRKSELSAIAFRSLTELYECGVKLKLSDSKDALDIRYIKSTLEIPKMRTDPRIMTASENMVSFEQCYCIQQKYVTDYVNLMANLVRSADDVELLMRHGILDGRTNQDICKFFYNLSRESLFNIDQFYYRCLCENLDDYCESLWHMWCATLIHEYFKNPFAVVVACLYLVIALVNVCISIMRYMKK